MVKLQCSIWIRAFNRVDHRFLEAVLFGAQIRAKLLLLDEFLVCEPQCYGESDWSKNKTKLLLVKFHLLELPPLALFACIGAFPVYIEGKPSPWWYHITWCHHLGQVYRDQSQKRCMWQGVKIKCDKSVDIQLGLWKSSPILSPFNWMDRSCKILGVWFSPNFQLEKNWLEVLKSVVAAVNMWLQSNLSLKGRAKMCVTSTPSSFIALVLPLPCATLDKALFSLFWGH